MTYIYLPKPILIAFIVSFLLLTFHVYAQTNGSYNFSVSSLKGTSIINPTSLQFGPDGRLYVSQQNGIIKIFTIVRQGANAYQVTNQGNYFLFLPVQTDQYLIKS